jgi:hypothetical protein
MSDSSGMRKEFIEKAIQALEDGLTQDILANPRPIKRKQNQPSWLIEQFLDAQIDLEQELSARFHGMSVMATVKFRQLGDNPNRYVASLATQDDSAQMIFDIDTQTGNLQTTFAWGAMLAQRFTLDDLIDKSQWLEMVRRQEGGIAFLWSAARWEQDYMICIARKHYSNFYAFSPYGLEAAARLTPDVSHKVMNWLENHWGKEQPPAPPSPQMLENW